MDPYAHIAAAPPRRGFFSTLAKGVCGVLMTGILCGSGVALYGMHIFDRKTGSLVDCVQETVRCLPEIQKNLPPALADALNDERRPNYVDKLKVTASVEGRADRHGTIRPMVEIRNTGDEMVSLISMRVVVTDDKGRPIAESHRWAATPLAAPDGDWPGPLLPGSTRKMGPRVYVNERGGDASAEYKVEVEITDVRVWKPGAVNAEKQGTGHVEMPRADASESRDE